MATQYLTHLALGPLVLLIAILFKAFPPKKINYIYGYRMPGAMINQDTWDEANRYSSKWLVYLSLVSTGIQFILIFLLTPGASLIFASVLICIAVLAVVPITERHLSKTFDEKGIRK